jgi:hypothetical protein
MANQVPLATKELKAVEEILVLTVLLVKLVEKEKTVIKAYVDLMESKVKRA